MRLRDLEVELVEHLGTPVIVVRADEGVEPERLNRTEYEQLSDYRFPKRKEDWLLGRNALKEILPILGRTDDTTNSTYAGSRISLTHAGGKAFAAATPATGRGIGIDYEPVRTLDRRIARWFLNDQESIWLNEQPGSSRNTELVRLWTVKEAAFKSHPDNARMSFHEFCISEPSALISDIAAGGHSIKATSIAWGSSYLSFAISEESQ